jgi:hypothetical protein
VSPRNKVVVVVVVQHNLYKGRDRLRYSMEKKYEIMRRFVWDFNSV